MLVGGGLGQRLQDVGLAPELDHTPAEKRSESGCSPSRHVSIVLCNTYKELRDVTGRNFNSFTKKSRQPF